MDSILVFDTTDVMSFSASDISGEFRGCGVGILFNLLDHLVNIASNLLLVVLQFVLLSPVVIKDDSSGDFDGVTVLADIGNFVLATVSDTGIGHGVTMVTIGAHLDANRAVFNSVSSSKFDGFTDCEDVLSFNLEPGSLVSSSVIVGVARVTLVRCSHSV